MNEQEIATLMRGAAPAIEALLTRAIEPLAQRIATFEQSAAQTASGVRSAVSGVVDRAVAFEVRSALSTLPEMVSIAVREALAALPPAEPGKSVDPADVERMVTDTVERTLAGWERPKDGNNVTVEDVTPLITRAVEEAVSALPPPPAGKDADPAATADLVRTEVKRAIAELPKPQDGRSVTPEELVPLIEERLPAVVSGAVARIPAPKDGAPGKLEMVRAWEDRVFYEAEVVTFDGATYQAQRDTGRTPPHEDWLCIVERGASGKDAGEIEICGTFDVTRAYKRLNVVALNGGSFIARRDDPGPCPGDGWQLVASQGARGKPGEAVRGDPGRPGPAVRGMNIDDQGMLTLTNADGTEVRCDLYPLLAKIASN